MKTKLRCIAPDGEFKTEGEFPTIQDAWNRASDMGSRWYFYPINVVTGAANSTRARILDVPEGMPKEWIGKSLSRLISAISADSQHACDYANGKCPFCIFPA